MSQQFGLFDASSMEAPFSESRSAPHVRPANMRTVHGIRDDDEFHRSGTHSVSCVRCVEDRLLDAQFVRECGGGMDAPEEVPIGSLKAMFVDEASGVSSRKRLIGLCQRTCVRAA